MMIAMSGANTANRVSRRMKRFQGRESSISHTGCSSRWQGDEA
jgi:hypothetical protein